jgi:hypothetical protein
MEAVEIRAVALDVQGHDLAPAARHDLGGAHHALKHKAAARGPLAFPRDALVGLERHRRHRHRLRGRGLGVRQDQAAGEHGQKGVFGGHGAGSSRDQGRERNRATQPPEGPIGADDVGVLALPVPDGSNPCVCGRAFPQGASGCRSPVEGKVQAARLGTGAGSHPGLPAARGGRVTLGVLSSCWPRGPEARSLPPRRPGLASGGGGGRRPRPVPARPPVPVEQPRRIRLGRGGAGPPALAVTPARLRPAKPGASATESPDEQPA